MDIQQTVLHEEIETRYLSYALSTIVSRALPDVRDGLKPVHRRILYAMHTIGASAAARSVKSARVVGEVIGKYHPHGDAAVYDAMVRMAQDFSLRYPLVDGQGNFGSLDGDNAAAMRYTESRLAPLADDFFQDLKLDTVALQRNYDATLDEPVVLPVRFPNLLINGSSGIAVGMSTSFPPHNMTEVCNALLACIDQDDLHTQDIMRLIPGPDLPTGGEILNSFDELVEIYRQGRGTIRVRGQHQVEQQKRGRMLLVLTAIPYSVNKARLIEKIAHFIHTRKLPLVNNVWDESTDQVRVVLELKNSQVDPEKVMAFLYRYTPMEISFPLNFTCLTPEGVPERMSIKELLLHFLDFRKDVITRRLGFELRQLRERVHILDGFLALFDALDEAIALIRRADQRAAAKKALMERFALDGDQAEAILELRLHSLVRLEEHRLRQEMSERRRRIGQIEAILASDRLVWQEVRSELLAVRHRYGDARRTVMRRKEADVQFTTEDFVEQEEVWIVLTRGGRVKRLKHFDPGTLLVREDDSVLSVFPANTLDRVAFFSSVGRVYVLPVFELPASGKGYGEPIQMIFSFQDGERVVAGTALKRPAEGCEPPAEASAGAAEGFAEEPLLPESELTVRQLSLFGGGESAAAPPSSVRGPGGAVDAGLILITRQGKALRLPLSTLRESTIRSGRQIMKLQQDDELALVATGDAPFLLVATEKRLAAVSTLEVTQLSGPGKGVRLMTADSTGVQRALAVRKSDHIWVMTKDGGRRVFPLEHFLTVHRGAKGRLVRGGIRDVGIVTPS
jgi:DNA gyrase subunit A